MATQLDSMNGRASSKTTTSKDSKPKSAARVGVNHENVIRPSRRRVASESATREKRNGQSVQTDRPLENSRISVNKNKPRLERKQDGAPDPEAIPEAIRNRFVQVGRKYYFPDGARAFTDRGNRLITPSENTEVIRGLVSIAQSRGWQRITVSGTDRFRKEAWFTAKLAGLQVNGYQPNSFEQGHLVRAAARASLEREGDRNSSDRARASLASQRDRSSTTAPGDAAHPRKLIRGRLVDHGHAPYRNETQQPMSYFVKVETSRGEKTYWGVDFERALRESLTKPELGDQVGLRAMHQDAVTVNTRELNKDGKVISEKQLATHRNRWIVEKEAFFQDRAAAAQTVRNPTIDARKGVREHPELAGTYLYLRGAREIAQRCIRDAEDQRKFVATVRNALADAVARGEPLPPIRLRNRSAKNKVTSSKVAERESALVRG